MLSSQLSCESESIIKLKKNLLKENELPSLQPKVSYQTLVSSRPWCWEIRDELDVFSAPGCYWAGVKASSGRLNDFYKEEQKCHSLRLRDIHKAYFVW